MNKFITLITSMLLCVSLSVAQVQEFQVDAQRGSIIRSIDGEYQLIYTEEGSGDGYFLLYRNGAPSAPAFKVMDGVRVRDVRIYGGRTAYFCGRYDLLDWGLVGKFDIFPVFAGTGAVDYGGCEWSGSTYKLMPTDLKRLDLFDSAGVVGMAMVGDSKTYLGFIEGGTTVASAWFDTQWEMCAHVNKGNFFRFTDVACLESSIVAVGTDSTGHGCHLKTFKPALHFPEYFYIYTPHFAQSIDFHSPVGDVLATRAGRDTVLLAHYDDETNVTTVLHRVGISPSTGLPMAPVETWITDISSAVPYGGGWKMLEIADIGRTAYLLQFAEFPSATGLSHRLSRIPTLTIPSIADLWLQLYGKMQSMDLDAMTLGPHLSGMHLGLVTYAPSWLQNMMPCYSYASQQVKLSAAAIVPADIDDDYRHPAVHTVSSHPEIIDIPMRIICNIKEGKEESK